MAELEKTFKAHMQSTADTRTPEEEHLQTAMGNVISKLNDETAQTLVALSQGNLAQAQQQTANVHSLKKALQQLSHRISGYEHEQISSAARKAGDDFHILWVTMLVITTISLLLAQIVSHAVSSSIVDSLSKVVDQLNDLAKGDADLTIRIPATGRDEIAGLATSFNMFSEKMNNILRSVRGSVDTVGSTSQEIASSAQEMEATVQSERNALEQIVEAVNDSANTTVDISKMAEQAANEIRIITTQSEEADTVMHQLIENSSAITNVVKVIDEISEKTNLLALNAAIEAARAGDAGRGFAVVADEVRKLAAHTTKSTSEINEVINLLQINVDRSKDALQKISSSIIGINQQMGQVSSSTHQQSSTIEEISATIQEFSHQMEQTSIAISEASTATTAMADEAAKLSQEVSLFKLA